MSKNMNDIVNDTIREGEKMLRDMKAATTKPTISKADELDEILFGAFVGMWCKDENGNFVSLDDKYGVLKDSLKKDFQEYLADQQRQLLARLLEQKEEACLDSMTDIVEFIRVQVIKDIREGLGR